MKKKEFSIAFAAIIIAGILFFSCTKDENVTQENGLEEPEMTMEIYTDCNNCIDLITNPDNPQYFEKEDTQEVHWGNFRRPFSKTVSIVYYNTETHFVIKVMSTNGWADLLINEEPVWGNGPVAANNWGVYTVELPDGWTACDKYSFSLKIAGFGPPALFEVDYLLIGICEEDNTIKDIDGNSYKIVQIGDQWWMAENLRVSKYNDETDIPFKEYDVEWYNISPAYCWYDNDYETYGTIYGALYNWFAVDSESNGGKNICPSGWHVPTDDEWSILTDYLIENGYNFDGTTSENKIAKALADTIYWMTSESVGAVGNTDFPEKRNITGFSGLPAGYRIPDGRFSRIEIDAIWWSSEEDMTHHLPFYRTLSYWDKGFRRGFSDKRHGNSIRCIKD